MNSTKIEENVTGETITHEHVRGVPRPPSQGRRRRVSLEDVIRISLLLSNQFIKPILDESFKREEKMIMTIDNTS